MNRHRTYIAPGDRVRYQKEFLRSIGAYSGPLPVAQGTVVSTKSLVHSTTIAVVHWDNNHRAEVPVRVNTANLELIGR